MNKNQFVLELEKKLKKLPIEEKEAAITYYKEYFEEAGEEKESEVIQELGSPSEIASQIMANYIVKETTSVEEGKFKHSISTVWIVFLAVLASPIALPIAICIITLILVTWILIISFLIVGIALILSGVVYGIVSIFVLVQDLFLGIAVLGTGMFAIGLGILITSGFSHLFVLYSSWITKKISKALLRKEKKNEE